MLPSANTHFTARGLASVFASLLPDDTGNGKSGLQRANKGTKRVLSERYLTNVLLKTCLDERCFADPGCEGHNPWPLGIKVMHNSYTGKNSQIVLAAPGLVCDVGLVDVTNGYAAAVLVNQLDTEAEATGLLLKDVARAVVGVQGANAGACPYVPWGKEQRATLTRAPGE